VTISSRALVQPEGTVHRTQNDLCSGMQQCACARFRGEWRVATTHSEIIHIVYSLPIRYSKVNSARAQDFVANDELLLPNPKAFT